MGNAFSDLLAPIEQESSKTRNLRSVLGALNSARGEIFESFRAVLGSEIAAKALTLKVLNLCLSRYHYRAQSEAVLSRPFGLILDPTNVCSLQCPGCVHSPTAKHLFDWPGSTMSAEDFAVVARTYGAYATHIMLCNYGEPLLNPRTPEFIRLSKAYFMRTQLSTSLSVGKVDAEAYVSSGLDFMILSIDGATQPVYRQYRRNGNLDYVYRNIENLVEARRRLNRGTPILHWQYLAFEHNAHEIPLAIERARELGVDQIQIVTPNDVRWDVPDIRPAGAEPRLVSFTSTVEQRLRDNVTGYEDAAVSRVLSEAFERQWQSDLPESNEPGAPSDHTCRWIYTNVTIDAKQRVVPCCAAPAKKYDLVFGEVNETQEAFNSGKYRESRRYFADPTQYRREDGLRILNNQEPHCVNCQWDQEHTNVSNQHVLQYLNSVAGEVMDAESLRILCSW